MPLKFLHDLSLVARTKGWSGQDDGQLRILLEDFGEGGQSFGCAFEGRCFGSCGVLGVRLVLRLLMVQSH